jgi:hypothetical protein
MLRIILVGVVLLTLSAAEPTRGANANIDLIALKRTCDAVLGRQIDSSAWRRLRPYCQDPRALDELQFYCGGGWCSNTIPLRGGISLEFRCSSSRELYRAWAPDEMIVYFVSLKRGERTIYHREHRSIRKA